MIEHIAFGITAAVAALAIRGWMHSVRMQMDCLYGSRCEHIKNQDIRAYQLHLGSGVFLR